MGDVACCAPLSLGERWGGSRAHLPLGSCNCSPAGVNVLIDAGQEVLGDAEGVLEQRVVWVVHGCVLQQVLGRGGVVSQGKQFWDSTRRQWGLNLHQRNSRAGH